MFRGNGTMNFQQILAGAILLSALVAATLWSANGTEKAVEVKGYVLDSACAFTKNLNKPVSRECALACAKAGSPLVILGQDGIIYWPISNRTPATGQNEKLFPFAGQRVTASGKLFERGGSHALVIDKVEPLSADK